MSLGGPSDLCELRHTDATPLNAASVIQGACIRMGTRVEQVVYGALWLLRFLSGIDMK